NRLPSLKIGPKSHSERGQWEKQKISRGNNRTPKPDRKRQSVPTCENRLIDPDFGSINPPAPGVLGLTPAEFQGVVFRPHLDLDVLEPGGGEPLPEPPLLDR